MWKANWINGQGKDSWCVQSFHSDCFHFTSFCHCVQRDKKDVFWRICIHWAVFVSVFYLRSEKDKCNASARMECSLSQRRPRASSPALHTELHQVLNGVTHQDFCVKSDSLSAADCPCHSLLNTHRLADSFGSSGCSVVYIFCMPYVPRLWETFLKPYSFTSCCHHSCHT